MKNQLVSKFETNPVYYILRKIKLIVLIDTTNYDFSLTGTSELVSISETNLKDVGRILASDSLIMPLTTNIEELSNTLLRVTTAFPNMTDPENPTNIRLSFNAK